MAPPDPRAQQPPSLHEGIDELESLLTDRPAPPPAQIPILDELAGAPEARQVEPTAGAPAGIDPRQLAELARRLEQRVESELADLAGVIRGVVKRCILEELRTYLPAATPSTQDGAQTAKRGEPEPPTPMGGPRAPG